MHTSQCGSDGMSGIFGMFKTTEWQNLISDFLNLKICLCLDIHNDLRLTGFPERVVIYNNCGHNLMRIQAYSIKPRHTVAFFFLVKIREDG